MINIIRTDSDNNDFITLVKSLDAYLAITDGEDHAFYSQYNKLDKIRHVVILYEDGTPIGCGAIKAYGPDAMEVKRMYVAPEGRNRGIASQILTELEKWAAELGYTRCILETGKRQTEAVALYKKNNYQVTANYGQYEGVENSVCFEKVLK
ncbi:GNAT family N-acetyltransferase [Dyadobacter pollutisoli]|jgi:GNAT superfamily N-acetyltransferase|uniref:GNAT family N-acetyltransferase n=1 Tax=Dyadobacter pollutisoli TaxID=2910158 RepID=A0A9E8NF83_9BACT|nr:GNAT family N-acetyltransferase [Dyadobacter pollutisoli]WAC14203.1 GNAT family N-acetyltransferase [Dyadobacter pollutisoli]